ncbi:MAG: phosphoribosylformylglycinamidine synthase subunit PurL, partial [Actinomycetota bacterium]
VALAEMAVRSGIGFRVAGITDHVALFSESPSRVVVCAQPDAAQEIYRRAADAGVPAAFLGGSGGDVVSFEGLCEVPLADAVTAWRDALPAAMGAGATH